MIKFHFPRCMPAYKHSYKLLLCSPASIYPPPPTFGRDYCHYIESFLCSHMIGLRGSFINELSASTIHGFHTKELFFPVRFRSWGKFYICENHIYLVYTSWCIPHCGQAKIEARSQFVPTKLTRNMIICVFCIFYEAKKYLIQKCRKV